MELKIGYLRADQHAAVPDEGGRATLSPDDVRNSKNRRKKFEKTTNKLAVKEQAEAAHLNESGGKKTDQGGEGSRGGKIIGRTKSGKPIYENHKHPTHKEFTSKDHKEARDLHVEASRSLMQSREFSAEATLKAKLREQAKEHGASANHHANQAQAKRGDSMDLKIKGLKVDQGGEGSRGGKIIGRTKSGKPIYESHGHPSHKDFTSQDHSKAAGIHRNLAEEANKKRKKTSFATPGKEVGELRKKHLEDRFKHEKAAESHERRAKKK